MIQFIKIGNIFQVNTFKDKIMQVVFTGLFIEIRQKTTHESRKNFLKKCQPDNQIIYTFERIIKNIIIFYGCKLSGIFVDDKNTEKNS
jgi:hypothetical protein